MARSLRKDEGPLESYLKPKSYLFWQGHIYQILERSLRSIIVEDTSLSEKGRRTIKITDLVMESGENPLVCAPTLDQLHEKLDVLSPPQSRRASADLPRSLLDKAGEVVRKYKKIERYLAEKEGEIEKSGEIFHLTLELQKICQKDNIDISVATYYNYRDTYRKYNGDQEAIAATFRRPRSLGHTRLTDAQVHFVDSAIVHYYMRKPPIRKVTLYELIKSTYEHTRGQWIDPGKYAGGVPQDLVVQLFDDKLPIEAIQENPEKVRLLVSITLPKRTWVYERVDALEMQPDEGKSLIVARYGEEMWEYEQMIFDHFAHVATRPLQYVFADYCLLKVFIVDEATRSEPSRLWLTLLIDAYSRSVLGIALTYEGPCIDTIQDALLNTIRPKTYLTKFGIEGDWPCYGIPLQLSLDNAWSNHSRIISIFRGSRAPGNN